MAELADALDSGSSRGNSVQVQLLLSAPNKHDNFDTKGIETIVLFSFYGIYCGIRLFGAYAFLFSFIVLLATRFSVRFRANLCSQYNHADTFIVE